MRIITSHDTHLTDVELLLMTFVPSAIIYIRGKILSVKVKQSTKTSLHKIQQHIAHCREYGDKMWQT